MLYICIWDTFTAPLGHLIGRLSLSKYTSTRENRCTGYSGSDWTFIWLIWYVTIPNKLRSDKQSAEWTLKTFISPKMCISWSRVETFISFFFFLSCFSTFLLKVGAMTSGSKPCTGTVVHVQNADAGSGPTQANPRKSNSSSNSFIWVR